MIKRLFFKNNTIPIISLIYEYFLILHLVKEHSGNVHVEEPGTGFLLDNIHHHFQVILEADTGKFRGIPIGKVASLGMVFKSFSNLI